MNVENLPNNRLEKIPKVIHYCWFGGGELPEQDKKCIESWKKYCPDYKIIRWDESNYDICKNKYMREAYEHKMWGFVPDYARLDIIYQNGGIYLDTDVELVRNMDELLVNDAFMGMQTDFMVNPGLGFGAQKGSKVIQDCMQTIYGNRSFIKGDGDIDTVASPHMMTDYLINHGWIQNQEKQVVENLIIYPSNFFCPMDVLTGELKVTPETYSIHHFHASWVDKEEKKIIQIERRIHRKYGVDKGKFLITLWSFPYKVKRSLRKRGLIGAILHFMKRKSK